MKGVVLSVLAGTMLASSSHVWLCERDGHVAAYQVWHDRDVCEVRYYPPNDGPVALHKGGECFPVIVELLKGVSKIGWRCDPPVMS